MRIQIKHANKLHSLDVDSSASATDLKEEIHRLTGVPANRMKVMVKSGILKDSTNLDSLGWKENQIISVIGTAGPLPAAPPVPSQFVEDQLMGSVANEASDPVGLFNLGQTCYLNSGMQMMRSMQELRPALDEPMINAASVEGRLATSIRSTLRTMDGETKPVLPVDLLNTLRAVAPQFAERDATGHYSQQDADEAWTQMINSLRVSIGSRRGSQSFMDELMGIKLLTSQKCLDNPDELVSVRTETVLKLECNISVNTNFLLSGIQDSLDQEVEKNSPSLGRSATYQHHSRMDSLPQYLMIHMVRFYWRRDIQKKAKIMRKVAFPLQLDVTDLMADELRTKTRPHHAAVKRISSNRADRARIARKSSITGAQQEEEIALRAEERREIASLLGSSDVEQGTILSGLYELCGMVTHKGASADSGHYIGWAERPHDVLAPLTIAEWSKFDDEKVSTVTGSFCGEQILALNGGGEDSVAYLLLYRAVAI